MKKIFKKKYFKFILFLNNYLLFKYDRNIRFTKDLY